MSERYGNCRRCKGMGSVDVRGRDGLTGDVSVLKRECVRCGGTGHEGGAEAYMSQELRRDVDHQAAIDRAAGAMRGTLL